MTDEQPANEERPEQFVGRHYHDLLGLQRALPTYPPLASDAEYSQWGGVLVQLKDRAKALTERKELVTKPLNEAIKNYRAMFAPAEDALDKCIADVKRRLETYLAARETAKAATVAELRTGTQTPEEQAATFAALATLEGTPGGDSTTIASVWTFDVTDESQIPAKYKCVDVKAIRAAITAGERTIPGVVIYKKQQVAVKRRGRKPKGEATE